MSINYRFLIQGTYGAVLTIISLEKPTLFVQSCKFNNYLFTAQNNQKVEIPLKNSFQYSKFFKHFSVFELLIDQVTIVKIEFDTRLLVKPVIILLIKKLTNFFQEI